MHTIIELQGSREYMEDRYYFEKGFYNNYDLYIICDGHGGDFVAEYSVNNIPGELRKQLSINKDIKKSVLNTFIELDGQLDIAESYMTGSTCLVILKHHDHIWVANCGDSRGMMNKGETFMQISWDHKPGHPAEKNRIENVGGDVIYVENVARVNGELAVSRSLGDKRLRPSVIPIPDVVKFDLQRDNKFIVMATDGLWDIMSCAQVNELISGEYEKVFSSDKTVLENSTKSLLSLISDKIYDNTTVIIIHIRR